MVAQMKEPIQSFPYKPPSDQIRKKYANIFELDKPLPNNIYKTIFDKSVSLILLAFSLPILCLLKLAFIIEGLIIPENKGPLFFYYWGISKGKKFKKWKIRLIKTKFIDQSKAKNGEWIAYSAEWNEETRTIVGAFVKKWYLDEIPQFWAVFIGKMSIVGPRPLSELHYKRDLDQGNISRFLIKGGMLGLGHIHKGTDEMGKPEYEYEYIQQYISKSSFRLFLLDLEIIWKGILLIFKGGGH